MNCVAAYDTLIDSVYESMRSPERLSSALSATKTFLNADACHLIGWDRSTLEPTLKISTGKAPDVDSEFARRSASGNSWSGLEFPHQSSSRPHPPHTTQPPTSPKPSPI